MLLKQDAALLILDHKVDGITAPRLPAEAHGKDSLVR
jgi:hypothetical protein